MSEVFDVPIHPTDATTLDAPDVRAVVDAPAPRNVAMDADCTASAQCSGARPV